MPIHRRWLRSHALALAIAVAVGVLATDELSSQRRGGTNRTTFINGHEAVEGEVLVRHRTNATGQIERERAEFQAEADEVESIGRRGARRLRSRRLGTRAMLDALRNNPDIEFVEPNYIVRSDATPNDPSFGSLWGIFNSGQYMSGSYGIAGADIDAMQAWDVTTGSRANVVGVIDTGIDYNHADLAANIWTAPRAFTVIIGGVAITCGAGTHGFNAITNSCDPMDDHSHGTHVAGTIGAVGNDGYGITGVNWVASMMGLKFLNSSGSGSTSDAIKAIEFAIQAKAALGVDANVRILSNSWGGGGYSQSLKNQIDAANTADMLFVAAAGNNASNNDSSPTYPANYSSPNVVSVLATTNRDQRASFSNWGSWTVHIGAPGQSILSTVLNNGYAYYNGTSMATPHVSGVAALVLAACPKSTSGLKSAVTTSGDAVYALQTITRNGARLNANNAVRSCQPPYLMVNGQPGTITVQGGSAITVDVRNGPGNVADWVTMVPLNAPAQTWGPYMYLSGSKTRPASGLRDATLWFTAPTEGGVYAFRFYENDTWSLIAQSPSFTVNAAYPVPTLTSVSPTSVLRGSPQMDIAVNGTGFADVSKVHINGAQRDTIVYGPTSLYVRATAADLANAGVLSVTVVNPSPGGGTSNSKPFTVLAPAAPPALRVNGGTSAITVAAGSTINAGVSDGPGNISDWVMMVPAGSPAQTWGPQYMYLSGSRTRPASGLTSATLAFTAPSSGGQFELRFYANDGWTLLATSPIVTVSAGNNPVPTLSSVSPTSVIAGSAFTLTVNGTGFVQGSQVYLDGSARTTTFMSATQLTAAIPATDVAAAATKAITVVSPGPGGGTSASATLTVTAPAPAPVPALTVNGGGNPVTVTPGATISVGVSNGPGNISDWVMMVPAGAPAQTWGPQYMYLSGSRTRPASGMTSATLAFIAPSSGSYEFRFYRNDGWTLLATSSVVTVQAASTAITLNGGSGAVTVGAGSTINVGVTNGPGNISDWLMMVPAGSPAQTWGTYKYLSGSKTRPATGLTNATVQFTAPSGGGQFEIRFYQNDTFTLLATSATITVTP